MTYAVRAWHEPTGSGVTICTVEVWGECNFVGGHELRDEEIDAYIADIQAARERARAMTGIEREPEPSAWHDEGWVRP